MTAVLTIAGVAVALLVAGLAGNRPPLLDPPGAWQRLRTYLGSNVAETRTEAGFPELRPRLYPVSGAELFRAAVDAIADLGWEIRTADSEALRIEAVVTTRLLRFKDDVALRIEPNAAGATVYCSSRSRIGRGDLGANARHILDLYERLDARLRGDPAGNP